jgi:hypothetical protein
MNYPHFHGELMNVHINTRYHVDMRRENKEWLKAYRKKRYRMFLEKGICPSCTKRKVAKNRTNCDECLLSKRLRLLKLYGLAPKQVEELLLKQHGRCAICKKRTRLRIDHDHKGGFVRGLLCNGCNVGLGMFCEDEKLLRAACRYLRISPVRWAAEVVNSVSLQ